MGFVTRLHALALVRLGCGGGSHAEPATVSIAPVPSQSTAAARLEPLPVATGSDANASVAFTKKAATEILTIAQAWRAKHPDDCPTALQLLEKQTRAATKSTDAWGQPFKIICDDDSTMVVSVGPDKKEGTADDIRVPAP